MKRLLVVLVMTMLVLTGCGGQNDTRSDEAKGNTAVADIPGTYTVPDGWVKSDKYSSEKATFYLPEGHEEEKAPDNIAVSAGSNNYGVDEHEKFRDAIVEQLLAQISDEDTEITGDGTYTERDYPLYIFTVKESDGVITQQYYIVGDHQYILVQLTNFSGSDKTADAARSLVDSFTWDDN